MEVSTKVNAFKKQTEQNIANLIHVLGNLDVKRNAGYSSALSVNDYTQFAEVVARIVSDGVTYELEYIRKGVMISQKTDLKTVEIEILNYFTNETMNDRAEFGTAPEIGSEITRERVTLVPFGESKRISLLLLTTPQGKHEFAAALVGMVKRYIRTVTVKAFEVIVAAALSSTVKRISARADYFELMNVDVMNYGICNKTEIGLRLLIDQLRQTITERCLDIKPRYLIADYSKVQSTLQTSDKYATMHGMGQAGADFSLGLNKSIQFSGVEVVPAPFAPTESWGRERTTGTYVPLMWRQGMSKDALLTKVKRFNGENGAYEELSLIDAFKNCGLFEMVRQDVRAAGSFAAMEREDIYGIQNWRLKPVEPAQQPYHPFMKSEGGGRYVYLDFCKRAHPIHLWLNNYTSSLYEIDKLRATRATKNEDDVAQAIEIQKIDDEILLIDGDVKKRWPGLGALAFSPHYRQRMTPVVMTAEHVGTIFESAQVLSQVNNTTNMSWEVGFTVQVASVVTKPGGIAAAPDAFYDGHIRGANSIPLNPQKAMALADRDYKMESAESPSLYYVVFPYWNSEDGIDVPAFKPTTSHPIHLKGCSPYDRLDENTQRFGGEYPFATFWSIVYGWAKVPNPKRLDDPKPNIALVCHLGSYIWVDSNGKDVHVSGRSHHGPIENEHSSMVRKFGMATLRGDK